MRHVIQFESFGETFEEPKLNESIQLSENLKAKISEWANKYKSVLQRMLAPFKNCKSEQEVAQMLNSKVGANEGWAEAKNVISKIFGGLAGGVATVSMASSLYGLFQLAQTEMVGAPLEYGMFGLLGAIVLYAVNCIFAPSNG